MSDRMAQLESTSAILGEYMLRGYTLTALTCDTCAVTPLMRESASSAAREGRAPIQFCAQCDGRPDGSSSGSVSATATASASSIIAQPAVGVGAPTTSSDDPHTQGASSSRLSTAAPPSQADTAAESISTLLLQGYALLSSNCPNTACRGIPLVGYPKRKDGSKDGRRMCVSCGGAWVDEGDMGGMKVVEKRPASSSVDDVGAEPAVESPRTRARRELYATGTRIVEEREERARAVEAEKGRGMDLDLDLDDEDEGEDQAQREEAVPVETNPAKKHSSIAAPLSPASIALSTTLDRLASSLERISPGSPDQANAFVNIKLHTEAMKDVLGVLEQVKRLQ